MGIDGDYTRIYTDQNIRIFNIGNWTGAQNITIENIWFKQTASGGVAFGGKSRADYPMFLRNLRFDGFGIAIYLLEAGNGTVIENIICVNCRLMLGNIRGFVKNAYFYYPGGVGIECGFGAPRGFVACYFDNCKVGILIQRNWNQTFRVKDCVFKDCTQGLKTQNFAEPPDYNWITVQDCDFIDCDYGVYFDCYTGNTNGTNVVSKSPSHWRLLLWVL